MDAYGIQDKICLGFREITPNKALHRTAIPLRSIAAGELGRPPDRRRPVEDMTVLSAGTAA
ncbi:MAG: hypothetical protein D6690_12330 [Nitrospirae bacterium]|nr:MAG: hypothetical protein D6690_12330 [Nitrospirota bacterium]